MASYTNKIKQTNYVIQTALLDLLGTVSFNKVSVNQIGAKADINRSTFYRHYVDKYQVLDEIEQEIITQLGAIPRNEFEQSTSISDLALNLEVIIDQMLDIVQGYQNTLSLLLGENGDANFQNYLKQVFLTRMDGSWQKIHRHLKVDNHHIDRELSADFIVAANMSILYYAVKHPMVSHQQITETFTKLLIRGPLNTLYQSISTED